MVKHLGALVAITVFVFGTIFLLTSDWPFGGPAEEAPTSGEAIMPAAESPMPEDEASPAQVAEAAPAEEAPAEAAPAEEPAEAAPAASEPADEAAVAETAEAAPAAGDEDAEAAPAEDEASAPAADETEATEEPAAQSDAAAEPAAQDEAMAAEETPAEETAAAAPAANDAAEADVAALTAAGEETYGQICQACHGAEGEGSVGPGFAGNANLEDAQYVAETIIHGREAMPPFGDQFDDEQIAAVATFIRNSWGNAFGAVTPDEVAAAR